MSDTNFNITTQKASTSNSGGSAPIVFQIFQGTDNPVASGFHNILGMSSNIAVTFPTTRDYYAILIVNGGIPHATLDDQLNWRIIFNNDAFDVANFNTTYYGPDTSQNRTNVTATQAFNRAASTNVPLRLQVSATNGNRVALDSGCFYTLVIL